MNEYKRGLKDAADFLRSEWEKWPYLDDDENIEDFAKAMELLGDPDEHIRYCKKKIGVRNGCECVMCAKSRKAIGL